MAQRKSFRTSLKVVVYECASSEKGKGRVYRSAPWRSSILGVAQSSLQSVEIDDSTSWRMWDTYGYVSTFQRVYMYCSSLTPTFCESSILKSLHNPDPGGGCSLPAPPASSDSTSPRGGGRAELGTGCVQSPPRGFRSGSDHPVPAPHTVGPVEVSWGGERLLRLTASGLLDSARVRGHFCRSSGRSGLC